jgi:DNA-binding CsgD family transcriptional regulator
VSYHGVSGFESLIGDLSARHTDVHFEVTGFTAVGDVAVARIAGATPDRPEGARELMLVVSFERQSIRGIQGFASEADAVAVAKRTRPAERQLTPREREIFGMLAQGLTGAQIAERLYLSRETVRTHIQNGTSRMGAKTRVEAVVRAMERGEIASS